MNIQLLLQLLMGQKARVPMDTQALMGRQDFSQVDKQMALPLYMESYSTQPKYRSPLDKQDELETLHNMYFTNPRNGVMPRRTRLGVEEGFRSGDMDWLLRSLGNF